LSAAPESLVALVERFDPSVFDAPGGRARVRLRVKGAGEWDAEVSRSRARLREAAADRRPDAEIRADARAWRGVAADLAGGMDVYRAGRLSVRRDLHLGVGFLAATAAAPGEGRLRFARVRTRVGRVATVEAGTGRPVLMLHNDLKALAHTLQNGMKIMRQFGFGHAELFHLLIISPFQLIRCGQRLPQPLRSG